MITLLEKHSNIANGVYEFIADSKSDLTNFETDIKTLLHGKMCGTHSKCFVIETGTWFYYGADGTLTEAADGSGGKNDEVYEITVTDDDIVYEPSDYAVDIDTSKINLSDEAYNYIKTNAPRFLKILNGTYIYYFVLSSDMSEGTDRYIFYQGATGIEGENFHLFYLNDDVDDPKCLIAYAGENPVIYSKIEDSVASTTKIAPVSMKAVYNAIQALFTYDETTKTLNITPIGGGS